tara:strand:+ start:606 stop:911 length:306 start_codon:yes stop_codon:yes gene_type:complete
MEFERNYRANHTQIPQQNVGASQNMSPYVTDDMWLGSQGYTPTGGWSAYHRAISVLQNVENSRRLFRENSTTPLPTLYQPANMVAMASLTQMHNNIIMDCD